MLCQQVSPQAESYIQNTEDTKSQVKSWIKVLDITQSTENATQVRNSQQQAQLIIHEETSKQYAPPGFSRGKKKP